MPQLTTLAVQDLKRRARDCRDACDAFGPVFVPVRPADLLVLCQTWLDIHTAKSATVPRITLPPSDPPADDPASSAS